MSVHRRHKYGAQPTMVDNIRFASKAEARRYLELKLLEKAGAIRDLELQPKFPLFVPSREAVLANVGFYVADFRYVDTRTGASVTEDVKSKPTRTAVYRLKRRMTEAQYGITITEVS